MNPARPHPLATGNLLQRRYCAWAQKHYEKMPPATREQAELIDAFLYSRRGAGVWLGMLGAITGSTWGLTASGMPLLLALALALIVWGSIPLMVLAAWIQPERFIGRKRRRGVAGGVALGLAGGLLGFTIGHVERHGRLDAGLLFTEFWNKLAIFVPAVVGAVALMLGLLWLVARARQQIVERELERLTLQQERDAAARQAAEARLALLRAQIEPHFVFNTLAALQHWVDRGDPRAGPLLHSLTAFLRGSTEAMARERATLADEAALAGHYLDILRARLGGRLVHEVEIAPAVAGAELPPGLVLTLVENAVEHGAEPAIAGARIEVRARALGDGRAELTVTDDGAGLAPGHTEGIGLRNSRERLAHALGGAAELTLAPGVPRGAVARIVFPLTAGAAGGTPERRPPRARAATAPEPDRAAVPTRTEGER
jgi:signal transduction histidine kinase